ncbi:8-oxoguanine deaminase [Salinisphaera sp. SPP-AMP-43]|uniref:8-oxoguanine deaminase n=1 Tax=Salinisphaera sp. SPP-AMP-43 TaxID=3121288 RepID=UPI003C6E330B
MSTLRIDNAEVIACFDDAGSQWRHASLWIEEGLITAIEPAGTSTQPADEVIDASGHILLPGLINTHHHFFQTLTRNLPAGQDAGLFNWLVAHYPIWARLDPEAIETATRIAIAELMLSGCTTAADHTYIWPNGARVDDQIHAAADMGFRFHASRGSMSVGESAGGLPPDHAVESEPAILVDSQRVIERYHDPSPGAMTRIALAPCSPFSVSMDLMRESAALARQYGVHLHTHLAETLDEDAFCRETFGKTPVEYAEHVGWTGDDVWFAHMVHPSAGELERLGVHRCGAAHCPSSNMRLASGVASIDKMQAAGLRVGLGVDGSASNDSSDMRAEARQAMLLARLARGASAMSAYDALRLATRGGAEVLGRDDIGALAPGMAADVIGYRLDSLGLAGGAVHDPVAALVFCNPPRVDLSIINGRPRVREGQLVEGDLSAWIARHNRIATRLVS